MRLNKIKWMILAIVLLLHIILISNFLSPHAQSFMDEKLIYLATTNLANSGSLEVSNHFNQNLSTCIFSSELLASNFEGQAFYATFSAAPLFFLLFFKIFGNNFQTAIVYIFSTLNIFLVYNITKGLTKREIVPILTAIAFMLMPVFIKFNISFFNIVPSLSFFLLTIYIFLISKSSKRYLLGGMSFALLLIIRPQDAFFVIPFIAIMIYRREKIKEYVCFLAPIIGIIILIGVLNLLFFGNALFNPPAYAQNFPCLQEKTADFYTRNGAIDSIKYLLFGENKIKAYLQHLSFFANATFAYPWIIAGLVVLFFSLYKKNELAIIMALTIVVSTLIYGRSIGAYWGYGQADLNSSFFRYMFYSYTGLTILIGTYFAKIKNKKLMLGILPIIIMIIFTLGIAAINYTENGLIKYKESRETNYANSEILYSVIDSSNVVILDFYSAQLIRDNRNNIIDINKIYVASRANKDKVDEELIRVINYSLSSGKGVFFIGSTKQKETMEAYDYIISQFNYSRVEEFPESYLSIKIQNAF